MIISRKTLTHTTIITALLWAAYIDTKVVSVTSEKEFDAMLKQKNPMVVKFFATWCGPCKQSKPKFEELSNDASLSAITFLEVDVDKYPKISKEYDVNSMPTVLLFSNGAVVDKHIGGGADFKSAVSQKIKTNLLTPKAAAKPAATKPAVAGKAQTQKKEKLAKKKPAAGVKEKPAMQSTPATTKKMKNVRSMNY